MQQNPALPGVNLHYSWVAHPLTQVATFIRTPPAEVRHAVVNTGQDQVGMLVAEMAGAVAGDLIGCALTATSIALIGEAATAGLCIVLIGGVIYLAVQNAKSR